MEKLNIQTTRLNIRHLELSDLPDFYIYRSNPEVTKYQSFDVMTIEEAEKFIQDNSALYFGKAGEWVQYGIEHIETGKLIGDCAIKLNAYDTRIAEIGITISHLEQKKVLQKKFYRAFFHFCLTQNKYTV